MIINKTGCNIAHEEIDGMMNGWQKDIFDYYSLGGSLELYKKPK